MTRVKKYKWMQKAFKNPGALHKQLGIPLDTNMGHMKTLLEKIRVTPLEHSVTNPLVVGKPEYKVTPLLKKRAVAALNAIRISQDR
jgi:hypothetical protein